MIEPTLEFQKPVPRALNIAITPNGVMTLFAGYVAANKTLRNKKMHQVKMFALVFGHAIFLALFVWLFR